jgi:hypothetical protein
MLIVARFLSRLPRYSVMMQTFDHVTLHRLARG